MLKVRRQSEGFKKGWLQDEVIGSYLNLLESLHPTVRYCEPVVVHAIMKDRSVKLYWAKQNLGNVETVLIPCNPSGFHWILLVLYVKKEEMMVIDPMQEHSMDQSCLKIGKEIFSRKFRVHNPKVALSALHILQRDSFNCGVLICFYSKMVSEGI